MRFEDDFGADRQMHVKGTGFDELVANQLHKYASSAPLQNVLICHR